MSLPFRPGKKMMKLFLMIIVAALLAGVLRAPAFLVCERSLKKADCVMVMLGGDSTAWKREAVFADREGGGRHLVDSGLAVVGPLPEIRGQRILENRLVPGLRVVCVNKKL